MTLADAEARELITGPDGLDQTLFVEAGAGSGKTTQLISRLLRLVDAGIELRRIAAITFTEKAAQELRDRLRARLSEGLDEVPEPARARRKVALAQLDSAAVGTLHSFAQRLLTHLPIEAGLPPRIEVLDEVGSVVAFEERWQDFLEKLLDDPSLTRTIHLCLAMGVRPDRFRDLARTFGDGWDLLEDPARTPWSASEPPTVDLADVEAAFAAVEALIPGCTNPACKLLARFEEQFRPWLDGLHTEHDEGVRLTSLMDPPTRGNFGRKPDWPDVAQVKAAIDAVRTAAQEAVARTTRGMVERVALAVRDFTLQAAHARQAAGELEFHDLLVLARALLRGDQGQEARRVLHSRYERILLDEFQDTDPIQIDIAVLLAAPPDVRFEDWADGAPVEGRLFVVGDPKQSIYRFRRADIGLFLRARSALVDQPTSLVTNFRSTPTVLGWVNDTFERLITFEEGSQPEYQPLDPARPDLPPSGGPGVALLGSVVHADEPKAAELRAREAADVAATISQALAEGWLVQDGSDATGEEQHRPAELGDITILLPARTSLPALEDALIQAGIPYRAESASLVYATSEIRALMATLRAISDPTDELATVTALRSVLFGCGDDDLADWKLRHGGRWNLRAPLPESVDADHPVAASMTYLRRLQRRAAWTSPPDLLAALVADRRLLETGVASRRPRDVWRRVRFVVDQARAWADSQHGGLRDYLSWATLQGSDHARVAEAVLPETDDDSVRIMTVHAAKGMQFPITIVSGMTSQPAGHRGAVQVLWGEPIQLKLGKGIGTEQWETFKAVDEVMGFHERIRLLYVACTRAQDHLVVSLHRSKDRGLGRTFPSGELLAWGCDGSGHGVPLAPTSGPLPARDRYAGASLPDPETWVAERTAAVKRGRWRRTVSATDHADLLPGSSDETTSPAAADPPAGSTGPSEVVAGLQKGRPDLDLPPWLKGRYGTAVGRAVHGVMQTVDLLTGEGLDAAVAAQCLAESIPDRADTVRALAQMALDSDIVQEAARSRHWRETYVAMPTEDDRILEGYIDLLFEREGEGLVVVDYKVAAAGVDLEERSEAYAPQMAAYAGALGATVRDVVETALLYLTPEGVTSASVLTGARRVTR